MRHQANEVESAMLESSADVFLRYVVTTLHDTRTYACDVLFRTGKPCVPDVHLKSCPGGTNQQLGHGACAERCLKGEVLSFLNRAFQQRLADSPRDTIGFGLGQAVIRFPDLSGRLIGIVVLRTGGTKLFAANAALASTIHACQNVYARDAGRNHYAYCFLRLRVAAMGAILPACAGDAANACWAPLRCAGVCICSSKASNSALSDVKEA